MEYCANLTAVVLNLFHILAANELFDNELFFFDKICTFVALFQANFYFNIIYSVN